jgi:hypothetical protein
VSAVFSVMHTEGRMRRSASLFRFTLVKILSRPLARTVLRGEFLSFGTRLELVLTDIGLIQSKAGTERSVPALLAVTRLQND